MSVETMLSPREIEIADAYAGGATYQAIAERLCIAPSTVRTHLATIYRKLEVSSKLELHARLKGTATAPAAPLDHAAVISELALDLEEALSRERALREVLSIIGDSRGDLRHVIPAILRYALDLCDAEFGILFECEGPDRFHASYTSGIPSAFEAWFAARGVFTPGPGTAMGRMAVAKDVVNIVDVRAEPIAHTDDPLRQATIDLGGARSFVAIPMLSGEALVGAFSIYRQRIRPFDATATRLAEIFAGQSAIALENARLMNELRAAPGLSKRS